MVASAAVALASSGANAADFPDKPVRIVVPFAAGTATDQLARALGQAMAADGKTQVIVDNKPGGNGFIGAEAVARSAPDGYTVFVTTNTTHAAAEHLYKKLPYDPVKDFAPITGLGKGGQILVVHGDSPVKTVSELVAQAKKEPGKISFGSGSSSSRDRRRTVPADGRRAVAARALQEQHLRRHRPAGQADRHDDHRLRHRPAACEERQAAGAGRVVEDPLAAAARGADHRRGRREGL